MTSNAREIYEREWRGIRDGSIEDDFGIIPGSIADYAHISMYDRKHCRCTGWTNSLTRLRFHHAKTIKMLHAIFS